VASTPAPAPSPPSLADDKRETRCTVEPSESAATVRISEHTWATSGCSLPTKAEAEMSGKGEGGGGRGVQQEGFPRILELLRVSWGS